MGIRKIDTGYSRYEKAAELFSEAIRVAEVVQGSMQVWAATFVNLGTCYRKLGSVTLPR
jgi:anaphase-promoting complex subunit 6